MSLPAAENTDPKPGQNADFGPPSRLFSADSRFQAQKKLTETMVFQQPANAAT
jgi:hypothetical protein